MRPALLLFVARLAVAQDGTLVVPPNGHYGVIDMTDPGAPTIIPPGSTLLGPNGFPLLGSDLGADRLLGSDLGAGRTLVRSAPLMGNEIAPPLMGSDTGTGEAPSAPAGSSEEESH